MQLPNIDVRLPCAGGARPDLVLMTCEATGAACGFAVAFRTNSSVVFLPKPAASSRLGCVVSPAFRGSARGGRGVVVELDEERGSNGFAVSVNATCSKMSETFVARLGPKLLSENVILKVEGNSARGGKSSGRSGVTSTHSNVSSASSYYYVSRIFQDQQQAAGAASIEFIESFASKYGNVDPTEVKQKREPMKECHCAIARLHSLVNAEDSEVSHSLQQCLRGSVERYVFSRVGSPLWRLYSGWHGALDTRFEQRAQQLRVVSDSDLLEKLGVGSAFRAGLVPETVAPKAASRSEKSENGSVLSGCTTSTASTAPCTDDGESTSTPCSPAPARGGKSSGDLYARASRALSQIDTLVGAGCGNNPREAVEALTLANTEMKMCALEASRGQAELAAMDDMVPVFIFVLARSALRRPLACAHFMLDALSEDERLGTEGRMVTLLEVAAIHVADELEVEELVAGSVQ